MSQTDGLVWQDGNRDVAAIGACGAGRRRTLLGRTPFRFPGRGRARAHFPYFAAQWLTNYFQEALASALRLVGLLQLCCTFWRNAVLPNRPSAPARPAARRASTNRSLSRRLSSCPRVFSPLSKCLRTSIPEECGHKAPTDGRSRPQPDGRVHSNFGAIHKSIPKRSSQIGW